MPSALSADLEAVCGQLFRAVISEVRRASRILSVFHADRPAQAAKRSDAQQHRAEPPFHEGKNAPCKQHQAAGSEKQSYKGFFHFCLLFGRAVSIGIHKNNAEQTCFSSGSALRLGVRLIIFDPVISQ